MIWSDITNKESIESCQTITTVCCKIVRSQTILLNFYNSQII